MGAGLLTWTWATWPLQMFFLYSGIVPQSSDYGRLVGIAYWIVDSSTDRAPSLTRNTSDSD